MIENCTVEGKNQISNVSNIFGSELIRAGSGTKMVQALNLGDAGDISIPHLFADTDVTAQLKLDTKVKIPYPATNKGSSYPANEAILLSGDNIFNLEVPAGTETAEIKYVVQKGSYHL